MLDYCSCPTFISVGCDEKWLLKNMEIWVHSVILLLQRGSRGKDCVS